jgi:hypothetical protein
LPSRISRAAGYPARRSALARGRTPRDRQRRSHPDCDASALDLPGGLPSQPADINLVDPAAEKLPSAIRNGR